MPLLAPTEYLFLTTRPLVRRLSVAQREWLYILPWTDIDDAVLVAKINYTDTTTADKNIVLGDLRQGEVNYVPIGYDVQDYAAVTPAKTIAFIEFTINDSAVDDKITAYPFTPQADQVHSFYYFNSLGGLDSLITTGDYQEQQKYSSLIGRRKVDDAYITQAGQYYAIEPRVIRNFTAFSGYKTRGEIQAVKDLLTINQAYELLSIGGEDILVPILITSSDFTLPTERDNLQMAVLNYRHAWDEVANDRIPAL